MTELKPTNGSKSFYGKAYYESTLHGTVRLKSYGTVVAEINGNVAVVYDYYSATTTSYVNSFLTTFGFRKVKGAECKGGLSINK